MPLDLRLCDKACTSCVKQYIKKHKLQKGNVFEIPCEGIPSVYLPDHILAAAPEDPTISLSMLDPVTWAAKFLDWHCLDPDGAVWKRKTTEGSLGDVPAYDVLKHETKARDGKSPYNRPYQATLLRCSSRKKVSRIGRQCGKTEALCIYILFCIFTNDYFSVEVITPYSSQIELIFTRLQHLIKSSPYLSGSIARCVKAPNYVLELYNGSTVRGFTASSRSGGDASSARGQKASLLIFDEADYLNSEDIDAALAMIINFPEAVVWMSSTPTGKRQSFYNTCFTAGTLISTANDLIPIETLCVGDSVLTHTGSLSMVSQTMKRPVDELVFDVKTYHINLGNAKTYVTAEHPYLTNNGWKPAKDLTLNDYILVPTRDKFSQTRPSLYYLPLQSHELKRRQIIECSTCSSREVARQYNTNRQTVNDLRRRVRLYGEQLAVYDLRKIKAYQKANNFLVSDKIFSRDFYRLAGYYLAKGSVSQTSKNCLGIVFTFNSNETLYIDEVVTLSRRLFDLCANPVYDYDHNVCHVVINANWLGIVFLSMFGCSEQKSIPGCMLGQDHELELKETLFLGDGGHRNGKSRKMALTLVAKRTVLQIFDMLLRHQIPASFSINTPKPGRKPTYTVSELEENNYFQRWKFINGLFYTKLCTLRVIPYIGDVYNLEVASEHTYVAGMLGVHNCMDRKFKEFHYPSHVNPNWTDDLDDFFRRRLTAAGYVHEILAEFGQEEEGVYQIKYVDAAQADYEYKDRRYTPGWTYSIGVDWNDVKIGTTISVVGWNSFDRHFYIVDQAIVQKEGWNLTQACQKVIELNRVWHPSWIYVDHGFGHMQVEQLHKYGLDSIHNKSKGPLHPDGKLAKIVKAYEFGGTVEVNDPFTHQMVKKPAKAFMVENSVRFFESSSLSYPRSDIILTKSLQGYRIKRVQQSGTPVYEQGDTEVGDHLLDSLNLALVAFTLETSEFGQPRYSSYISFSDTRLGENTPIALDKRPEAPASRLDVDFGSKLPASHTVQHTTSVWSWPGFSYDAPPPTRNRNKQIGRSLIGNMRRARPTRKKI